VGTFGLYHTPYRIQQQIAKLFIKFLILTLALCFLIWNIAASNGYKK
jgi:hypothetical protein